MSFPFSKTDVLSRSVALCLCGQAGGLSAAGLSLTSALSPLRRGGAAGLRGKVRLEPGARASRRRLQGGGRRQKEEAETVPAG